MKRLTTYVIVFLITYSMGLVTGLPPPDVRNDDTWLILISCVISGIFLGVGFAIGCNSKGHGYSRLRDFDSPSSTGITLKTLSLEGDGIDLKASFEKAMRARHLSSSSTRETLLLVNPKEVILYKIIGEVTNESSGF